MKSLPSCWGALHEAWKQITEGLCNWSRCYVLYLCGVHPVALLTYTIQTYNIKNIYIYGPQLQLQLLYSSNPHYMFRPLWAILRWKRINIKFRILAKTITLQHYIHYFQDKWHSHGNNGCNVVVWWSSQEYEIWCWSVFAWGWPVGDEICSKDLKNKEVVSCDCGPYIYIYFILYVTFF
jgi:hypothetical protein